MARSVRIYGYQRHEKTASIYTPDQDLNLDLVIGDLVYRESSTLDHAAIKAVTVQPRSQLSLRYSQRIYYRTVIVAVLYRLVSGVIVCLRKIFYLQATVQHIVDTRLYFKMAKRKEETFVWCHEKDSSSDNSDFSLRESDEDSNILSEEEDIDTASSGPNGTSLLPGDFAVVKVYGKTKESFRLYVSRVSHPSGAGYIGTFYKRTPQTMRFSETLEESYFSHQDVVHKLSTPISSSSARFKDMISFPDDLSDLTIY
uniref:(California timema) hypothetical protein n=1 Tax=Timema californicum TaxID=61474 RepID=A0A7R9JCI5_TIMCA|nr:unnamed protein product [Timema californicum]